MKAHEIETLITSILKPEYGVPSETDNGILLGDRERDVSRMAVCWSPTEQVLREAVAIGAQAVFSHEIPFIPCGETASELWKIPVQADIPANVKRRRIYEDARIVLFKYHYPLDGWPVWGMPRALASALGFDPDKAEWVNRFVPVFDFQPRSLWEFSEHVRVSLGMSGIDIAGDLDRKVSRVALMVGGFGVRLWLSEFARQAGADVMLVGEMLDYTARAAREADIAVIKASHYATENPAVIQFAEHLRTLVKDELEVIYLPSGESWEHFGGGA